MIEEKTFGRADRLALRAKLGGGSGAYVSTNRWRGDFPGLSEDWHYLDSAATTQKPQAMIDAIVQGYGKDYASVHRGIYRRSAEMTLRYEQARVRVAGFIGAASPDECVFVRGASEAINLVAQSWGRSQLRAGDRIMLSQLEHHSNIVPWQILAKERDLVIDVCPLTEDGRIDLDAAEAMLTPAHKLMALAHVSNALGSRLDVARAARIAHAQGALLLVDGCQAVARMAVDVQALGADFYVFSGHKLYGPTGIGVLWARSELLSAMPPWQGGGAMIEQVSFTKTRFAPPPARFEAGTPHIIGALGLAAAIDYVAAIGLDAIGEHEALLLKAMRSQLVAIPGIQLFGPADSAGILSFALQGVHAHDMATILDDAGVAVRAGHHCAQPLMEHLGVTATVRASLGLYNDDRDVAALAAGVQRARRIFGIE